MKIKNLLVLLLSLFILGSLCYGFEEKRTIRVGISNQSFSSWEFQKVKLSSQNIIKIVDMSQNTPIDEIPANSNIEVIMTLGVFNICINNELKYESLTGPLLFSSNADLEITELNRKGIPAKYKGMFELRANSSGQKFYIINVVDLENYLKGVVPNEMPVSFGLEALKAQAIAAKNYAANAAISKYYDVVDSTASQVYYGSNSYKEISNQAVVQTRGIYALYNEQPISALYYSTSGGISDNWVDVFGDNKGDLHPYLKMKYETTSKPLKTESEVKDFYSNKNGFDTNSPKHRWSYEFTRTELENILHSTLQQQSKAGLVEPKYDGDIKLSGLKDIKALKRTYSGKITELSIVTDDETYTIKTQLGIRRVIKKDGAMLPSSNFFIEKEGEEELQADNSQDTTHSLGILKLYDKIAQEKYPKIFKITGGGYGHGVGMSQFGAYNLAKAGKKYPEILHFYYTDITLSTLPKNVSYNEYDIKYASEFYFDNSAYSKAYLIIDNKRKASEFPFKINDYEFQETSSAAADELIKMDITQYLKQGQNILTFYPLNKRDKGKYITYRIQFI